MILNRLIFNLKSLLDFVDFYFSLVYEVFAVRYFFWVMNLGARLHLRQTEGRCPIRLSSKGVQHQELFYSSLFT